jgi:hypothetical protein
MSGRFDGQINTATESQHTDVLQFCPASLVVNNPSSKWLYFEDPKVWVPPYKTGFIFNWKTTNQYVTIDTNLTQGNIPPLSVVDGTVTILYTTDQLAPFAGNDFIAAKAQALGIMLGISGLTNAPVNINLPPGIVSVSLMCTTQCKAGVFLGGLTTGISYFNEAQLPKGPVSDSGLFSSGSLLINPLDTVLQLQVSVDPSASTVWLIGYQVAGIPGVQQVAGVSGAQPIPVALKTPTQVALNVLGFANIGMAPGLASLLIAGVAAKQITVYGYQWTMIPGASAAGAYIFDIEDTGGTQSITRGEVSIATFVGQNGLSASHNFLPSGLVLPVGVGIRIIAGANAGAITVQGVIDYTGPS